METCFACQRTFPTSQGRKAHQKSCEQYRERRKQKAALGNARLRQPLPQAGRLNTPPTFGSQQTAMAQPADPFAPLLDLLKTNGATPSNPANAETPAQRRRALLQEAKKTVIDQYWSPHSQLPDK